MTSMAFVMGVLPLVLSKGAGSEMRHAMGVAVFAGMIGVTAFGLFLTPVFYVLLRALTGNRSAQAARARAARHGGARRRRGRGPPPGAADSPCSHRPPRPRHADE
jgi:multidrug efflux pump